MTTTTSTMAYTPDRYLSTSLSSLSSSRQQSSQIAKAYRQAAQLFLTRRLPEAYSTIEPIISKPAPTLNEKRQVNGDDSNTETDDSEPAPIANASRTTRIKVWSFYLTFLNSVVELGPEEGKHAFGNARWKAFVQKCRDGSVWDEVVNTGYGGVEGSVDADVVVNLATLLLTHSPSQELNQRRLETYLSATAQPSFDLPASAFNSSPRAVMARRNSNNHNVGTSTPRDLNTRLKLLELYTLHILPRNGAWDYSREFITMSEVLDDDRKEAFLQALHGLKEEMENQNRREEELQQAQEDELKRKAEEEKRAREEAERREEEQMRKRRKEELDGSPTSQSPVSRKSDRTGGTGQGRANGTISQPHNTTRSSPKKSLSKPPSKKTLNNVFHNIFRNLQELVTGTAQSLRTNPLAVIRMLLFLVAFMMMVGNREVRERVRRVVGTAWDKIRRTVGMGVKVSYI